MRCYGKIFGREQCFTRIEKYPLNLCCSHIARSPCCASFTSDATTSGPLLARSLKASTSNQSPFKSRYCQQSGSFCRRRWGIGRKNWKSKFCKEDLCIETTSCLVLQSKHQKSLFLAESIVIHKVIGGAKAEKWTLLEKLERKHWSSK